MQTSESDQLDPMLLDRIVSLVSKVTSFPPERLSAETRLYHDLGVDGDVAEDLMLDFGSEFSSDLKSFDFNRHFGPEVPSWNPFYWGYLLLFRRDRLNSKCTAIKKVPLAIKDLYKAAESKTFPDLSNRGAE